MTTYNFKITEYKPDEPWVIVSTGRGSVELPDGQNFHAWARERYPAARFRIDLEREPFRWASRQ